MTERDIVERLRDCPASDASDALDARFVESLMRKAAKDLEEAAAEITRLREMVTTAVSTEREECAKIAEQDTSPNAELIAASIRARTP